MAGLASTVEARRPSVSARYLPSIIECPPFGYVSALRQSGRRLSTARLPEVEIVPLPLRSGRGRVGISVEDRAKGILQRTEIRFVRPPFVGGIAIDRPADLLRARGSNGPLGLVEF